MTESSRIGIRDIAKRCGVSVTAVSLVLNDKARQYGLKEETIDRIQQVIKDCDYRPSVRGRLARTGKSRMVGLVAESTFDEKWGELYFAIERHLRTIGYYLITSSVSSQNDAYPTIEKLLDIPVDALVIRCPGQDVIRECASLGIPLIALEHVDGAPAVIKGDDVEIGRVAARCLIDGGARNPVLAYPINIVRGDHERMDAFRAEFTRVGGIVHALDCAPLDGDGAVAKCYVGAFLTDVHRRTGMPVDAIFGHDRYCIALQAILRRSAIAVPEAVQIIGCHDYSWSRYVDPPITTVAADFTVIGERVFRCLRERLEAGAPTLPASSDLVMPTVRHRGTTRRDGGHDRMTNT